MRSTLRPTGTPYRMSVATASAVFRVRLTRTISRALPRTAAAMAEAQPTLPVPTIPIFIGPSGVGRSQRDDSDDRYHSSPFSLHMILRLSSERWRGRERQADVFVAQWCCKTGGFDFSVNNQPA